MVRLTKHLEEKKIKALGLVSDATSVRNPDLEETLDFLIEHLTSVSKKTQRNP